MRDDIVTITASLLVREEHGRLNAYVAMPTGKPYRIASLLMFAQPLSEAWHEDFRVLCQTIATEFFAKQSLRPNWVTPNAKANLDFFENNFQATPKG